VIPCPNCSEPTPDGLLCWHNPGKVDPRTGRDADGGCTAALRANLTALPGWMRDLTAAYTRTIRRGRMSLPGLARPTSDEEESPLPFDPAAAILRDQVVNMLGTWIREVDAGDTRGLAHNVRAWCNWMLDRIVRIRGHQAVVEIVADLSDAVFRIQHAVDIAPLLLYVGPCGICGHELFARSEDETLTCPRCRQVLSGIEDAYVPEYDVRQHRDQMRAELAGMNASRADILESVAPLFRVEIKPGTFDSWVDRGRLLSVGRREGVAVYPISDALGLAEQAQRRRKVS
jgi:hypothetical protein